MGIDWNKAIVMASGSIVVIILGICVALGHNSAVTDGLLAASGLILGGQLVSSKIIKK